MGSDYVLNHDFGYEGSLEHININKLKLRNINDLKVYIENVIPTILVANYKDGIIEFIDDSKRVELKIELI